MGRFQRGREEGEPFTAHGLITFWDEFGGAVTIRVLHATVTRYKTNGVSHEAPPVQEVGKSHGGRGHGRQTELPWDFEEVPHTDKWQRNAASPPLNASSTDAPEERCGLDADQNSHGSRSSGPWSNPTHSTDSPSTSGHQSARTRSLPHHTPHPRQPKDIATTSDDNLIDFVGSDYLLKESSEKSTPSPARRRVRQEAHRSFSSGQDSSSPERTTGTMTDPSARQRRRKQAKTTESSKR